jgi:hypothetical protein
LFLGRLAKELLELLRMLENYSFLPHFLIKG